MSRARGTFLSLVPGAFAYPFSAAGLMTLAGAGLLFSLVERGGCLASLLVSGFTYSLMFQIVRTTALGHEDLPVGGDSDPWAAVNALLLGVCALVVACLPVVAYVALRYEAASVLEAESPLAMLKFDPALYLALMVGALWGTSALMFAATQSPFLAVISPLSALRVARVAGFDFLAATVLFWVLLGGEQFVKGISGGFEEIVPVPVVARAFARAMTLYLPLVSARMLGLFLLVRGPALGYGRLDDALVPALGDTVPEPPQAPAPVETESPLEPAPAQEQEASLPPPQAAVEHSPPSLLQPSFEPLDVDLSDEPPPSAAFQPVAATVASPADFGGAFDFDLPPLPEPPPPAGATSEAWGDLDAAWPEPSTAATEVLSPDAVAQAQQQASRGKPPQSS